MIQVTPAFLNSIETTTNEKPSFARDFKRYQIQSKRISQMIAFVWRYIEDSETAKELDKYFKNTKIGDKEYKLKDLLFAAPNPENPEEQIRFELMQKVFADTAEPLKEALFNKDEYNIEVDVSEFRTQLEDPRIGGDDVWTAVMAYPPRPFISDEGQLTNQELDEWINNTEDGKYVADNPFIPLCCS